MLFNSYIFIFGFLPIALVGFFLLAQWNRKCAAAWLALASFVFYGWWDYHYVPLLLASAAFNWTLGVQLCRQTKLRKPLLVAGVAANLALLGYFKYAGFLVATIDAVGGLDFVVPAVVLPLGISFFTFTQIAFLADCYLARAREYDPIYYLLFVSYFPHLIAGPIIHHATVMPQFGKPVIYRLDAAAFSTGLAFFSIGLFKKILLADPIGVYADSGFSAAQPGLWQAWGGALAYALQIYFDFSGYSDMAVGLSFLFGIRLPFNFNSPYKADSIIEFWRRWHMTLSAFLRDYLYIPMGGNRKGPTQRYVNVLLTMLIGGLWHGAGWTFVIWGGLHGMFLVINHAWRAVRHRLHWIRSYEARAVGKVSACAVTFLAVVVAWVFFRAATVDHAFNMIAGMAGINGWGAGPGGRQLVLTFILCAIAFSSPNTQEIIGGSRRIPLISSGPRLAVLAATLLVAAIIPLGTPSSFLYFNF
jgi:alginate O-acetyltransferase complex protein AlgI